MAVLAPYCLHLLILAEFVPAGPPTFLKVQATTYTGSIARVVALIEEV
jgi:hypothetical protein